MAEFGKKFWLKVTGRGHDTRQRYCSMEYTKAITEVLYKDGSLRDIYISINGVEGYRRLATFLDRSGIPYSITMDDQCVDISTAIDEFSKGLNRLAPKLSFFIYDMFFICHFFDTNELEIDFSPSEVSSEKKWNKCMNLFHNLSRFFSCPIKIHPENDKNHVLYETTPPAKSR